MTRGIVDVKGLAVRALHVMGEELGWTPPSPVYLVRMLLATRRARAAAR